MTRYWAGTMNRVTKSEGENSLPINPKYWEQDKENWWEITKEQYEENLCQAWGTAENSFWHC